MQMPNSTPQGIAGLMQKPQGQQPMPSPGKASPMAGLGGVDDRVSAYMGNTKPLEQRYAMSQDLLDLLALQKIKSQKDAASRQMQMQMAQQQAQSGEAGMTVAQQREKQVSEMTKNELAQQRGATAQQQNVEQQANLQKLMGGVASAPGAAIAAQPQAMAAGGIVGYSKGGNVLDQARERRKAAQQKLYSYGLRQRQQDPEGFQAAQAEFQAAQEAVQNAEKGYAAEMSAAGIDKPISSASPIGATARFAQAPTAPPAPIVTGTPDLPVTPPAPRPAPPAPPQAPPQAAPPKPPGLLGLPGAAGNPAASAQVQPPAAGPQNDFGREVQNAARTNFNLNEQTAKLDEEKRAEQRMALTPEQRNVYNEGIGGLQKMYQEQYDPERQRQEGLKRFLIGAGGRRYGELGGGAESAMDYDAAQRAAKLGEFKGIQSARTGLIDIDRANVKEGIGAGQKAYEQTATSKRTGLDAGSRLYGDDVRSRDTLFDITQGSKDKALDREIEKLKIRVQADATAASRENLSFEKARTMYANTLNKVDQLERNLEKDFNADPALGMLLMQDPTKLKPEDKNRLDIAKLELEQKKAKIRKEMEPVLESARQKLGVTDSSLSPSDRALIEQYKKGK
jgi:hypothetical protein